MNIRCYLGIASTLILYVLLIAAVVSDIRSMKVSNRLILVGISLGLVSALLKGGPINFIRALSNMFFPVILLFLFYLLGAIGAGDIKLFSVIGCFFEFRLLCICIVWSFVLAGAVSLVQLLRNLHVEKDKRKRKIHMTIEIFLGALLAVIGQGLLLF